MKKFYSKPRVKIDFSLDIVTTSPEVETGRVPFPTNYSETGVSVTFVSDEVEETFNTQGN